MPELIAAPARVPVPGGKVIDEFAGRVASDDAGVSVAVMDAPPGWSEPAQQPDFDEVTVVLGGTLRVSHDAGSLTVAAGQAVITRAGERVQFSVGLDGARYVAVCVPAFDVGLAHREPG